MKRKTKNSYPGPVFPDFCRRQWVNAEARKLWEPRISAIGRAFAAAERFSVENGIRSVAMQSVSPYQIPELAQKTAQRGLTVVPLATEGMIDDYAASPVPHREGESWQYRIILSIPGVVVKFIEAWTSGNDETIGAMLGYPDCCRKFFVDTWGNGSVDPTWQMNDKLTGGPIEANILLRWLGVRWVPHMPCGFHCAATITFGKAMREIVPKREARWIDELLAMPMLWSALNGIGEVVTPIVTLNFRSDIWHKLREIPRDSASYPEAGAHGLRFPYRPAGRADQKTPDPDPVEKYLWTDNGFSSREAMEKAHEMILAALEIDFASQVTYEGKITCGAIIDLGAGNGELLRKLGRDRFVGIESDSQRVARRVWKGIKLGQLRDVENMFPDQHFAVAIISVRRFEEMIEAEIKKLRAWLESSVDRVLIYSYDDPQFARLVIPREVQFHGG